MKRLSTFFLLQFISISVFAQVGVGPDEYFFKSKVDDFSEEALKQFKDSKTVFLYGEKDDSAALYNMLKQVWAVTDISVMHYKNVDAINFDSVSVFSIEESSSGTIAANLQLWMQNTNKKGKVSRVSFCQIGLHAKNLIGIADDLYEITNELKSKKAATAYEYFYSKNRFANLEIGLLKNYLKVANQFLSQDTTLSPFKTVDINAEIHELKTKTIYIPAYAVEKFNANTSSYENISAEEIAKIFDKYPYKYEVISLDNLNYRILNAKEPFYYLSFVRTLSSKQLTIYNSVKGSVIYNSYDLNYYNIIGADFKKISKVIASF